MIRDETSKHRLVRERDGNRRGGGERFIAAEEHDPAHFCGRDEAP